MDYQAVTVNNLIEIAIPRTENGPVQNVISITQSEHPFSVFKIIHSGNPIGRVEVNAANGDCGRHDIVSIRFIPEVREMQDNASGPTALRPDSVPMDAPIHSTLAPVSPPLSTSSWCPAVILWLLLKVHTLFNLCTGMITFLVNAKPTDEARTNAFGNVDNRTETEVANLKAHLNAQAQEFKDRLENEMFISKDSLQMEVHNALLTLRDFQAQIQTEVETTLGIMNHRVEELLQFLTRVINAQGTVG